MEKASEEVQRILDNLAGEIVAHISNKKNEKVMSSDAEFF
jgi:hypothetical protein